jgi:hypothetical protein
VNSVSVSDFLCFKNSTPPVNGFIIFF